MAVLVLPAALSIAPGWNINRSAWRRATHAAIATDEAPSTSVVVEGRRPVSPQLPMILWIAGVVAMLGRVVLGHWRVRSLFGAAERIDDPLVGETAARIGFGRAVILKRSTATDVPLSYGLIRATVLLPGESIHWSAERRRIVLAHEMIHARRLDSLWGLMAQCALAVNWFNPLAWLAVRQFRKEQERSCDDAVVLAGIASTLYAAHLVDLARSIAIPEPALGMAERFDLEGRVHALLDPARRRGAVSRKLCGAMFLAALALIVPLAAVRAQSSAVKQIETEAKPVESKKQVAIVAIHKPVRRAAVHEQPASHEEPQSASPSILQGAVYDPSGAVVPGATITLKNTASSNEEAAVADDAGSYKLQGLPPGEYVVKVRKRGFATYQNVMTLEAGAPATVNVHLALGDGEESMMITAKRPDSAAVSSAAPQRIRIGGMVQAFNLIRKVTPMYLRRPGRREWKGPCFCAPSFPNPAAC